MGTPFRDHYDASHIDRMNARLRQGGYPTLDTKQREALAAELAPQAMKARVRTLSGVLGRQLVPAASARDTLEHATRFACLDEHWSGFDAWPTLDVVEQLGPSAPEAALEALHTLTSRFSGEFAIRPLLREAPKQVLRRLAIWTQDPDEHVRRLVSEGTRTRLPWGIRVPGLIARPDDALALVERLRDDPSEYVRRSVANHLNDLSRDHPERVLRVCRAWLRGASPERERLVRHALRSLVKAGSRDALALLGAHAPDLAAARFTLDPTRVVIGASATWTAELQSRSATSQRLVVDVRLHRPLASGRRSHRVVKGAVIELAAGERATLRRSLSFAPVTVRRYYPGEALLELLVNGEVAASASFELVDEP